MNINKWILTLLPLQEPFSSMYPSSGATAAQAGPFAANSQRPTSLQPGSRHSTLPMNAPEPGLLSPRHQNSHSQNYFPQDQTQPGRDRFGSVMSAYSQPDDPQTQAYEAPSNPYYAASHAPSYHTEDHSYNYFAGESYDPPPQPTYNVQQHYGQRGPLAYDADQR